VVFLEIHASLVKPVDSQLEGNPFIKNIMLMSDVLDLNGANNTASKLCELAVKHVLSLMPFFKAVDVS
jgi:hypothetical protein